MKTLKTVTYLGLTTWFLANLAVAQLSGGSAVGTTGHSATQQMGNPSTATNMQNGISQPTTGATNLGNTTNSTAQGNSNVTDRANTPNSFPSTNNPNPNGNMQPRYNSDNPSGIGPGNTYFSTPSPTSTPYNR